MQQKVGMILVFEFESSLNFRIMIDCQKIPTFPKIPIN
jgi:hypothetical protein